MPIGEFENWRACIKAQIAKGYSKDAAEGICGLIEKRAKEKQ